MQETPPLPAMRLQPGLSETLNGGERHPNACQSCGYPGLPLGAVLLPPNIEPFVTWSECDEWDRPQRPPVLVVLCRPCSDRLIESHARLYHQVDRNAPQPGAMQLCVDCRRRDGLTCTTVGQPVIEQPPPDVMHVCRSPRSTSGWVKIWKPPTKCQSREVA